MKEKNQNGITLIALVITVIILIILAGVGISMITGEQGLFARANYAANLYKGAQQNEAEAINAILNNEYLSGLLSFSLSATATDNSITISGQTTGNGTVKYKYAILETAGEVDWDSITETTDTSKTFTTLMDGSTALTKGTTYYVYMQAIDEEGHIQLAGNNGLAIKTKSLEYDFTTGNDYGFTSIKGAGNFIRGIGFKGNAFEDDSDGKETTKYSLKQGKNVVLSGDFEVSFDITFPNSNSAWQSVLLINLINDSNSELMTWVSDWENYRSMLSFSTNVQGSNVINWYDGNNTYNDLSGRYGCKRTGSTLQFYWINSGGEKSLLGSYNFNGSLTFDSLDIAYITYKGVAYSADLAIKSIYIGEPKYL